MANAAELGTKHECPSCGTKYYDLGKADAPCPKCGATADDEDTVKKSPDKKKKTKAKKKSSAKKS